jgi:hypothetical protein
MKEYMIKAKKNGGRASIAAAAGICMRLNAFKNGFDASIAAAAGRIDAFSIHACTQD